MDAIMWFLDVAWKILGLILGWMILKFILTNGKETIKDILETLHLGMQALSIKARMLLREYLKRKPEDKKKDQDKDEPIEMSFDEWRDFNKFMEAMKSDKPFVLKK